MDSSAAITAPVVDGRNRFAFAAWLFLRLLALIHLIAFASFWMQLDGLIGPHGLSPAQAYFNAAHDQLGAGGWRQLPSLCWWIGAEHALPLLCAAGIVVSLLLFAGIAPALCLALLWTAYLSLVTAGQVFFGYQWDSLLLETTLLAVLLAPWSLCPLWRHVEPPRIARWLLWWLLVRLMFLSGAVKLTSGDPTWHNLTALVYHYETQPLPTTLAWHAHQFPLWVQRTSCAIMFFIELPLPWLVFAPRAFRHVAALLVIAFMALIFLTGNYTFFNLLTVALAVLCLDDAWWVRCLRRVPSAASPSRCAPSWLLLPVGIFIVLFTFVQGWARTSRQPLFAHAYWSVEQLVSPFRSLNSYGLFAVMTTTRPELIIEGSNDGREWVAYELPHKPGDLARRPDYVAPFQPRLDWQLWFAALEPSSQNPWVFSLCNHLLHGTPDVLRLFARNPFPDQPPRFVRVIRYEYHFTESAERSRNGHWWRRTPLDYYVEPVSLR